MKVSFNNNSIDVSVTNIDTLEAINRVQDDIAAIKKSKGLTDTINGIKNVESEVKAIVESNDGDFSTFFPKRDYLEYLKFTQAVVEAFNNADFKEIKL